MTVQDEVDAIFRKVMRISGEMPIDSLKQETLEGWDSLRHAELIIKLQERFKIRLQVEEIRRATSVPALRRIVTERASE